MIQSILYYLQITDAHLPDYRVYFPRRAPNLFFSAQLVPCSSFTKFLLRAELSAEASSPKQKNLVIKTSKKKNIE